MPRGGAREGTPGKSYPQRTDMHQAVRVGPAAQYGAGKRLADAQKVIPLPTTASTTAGSGGGPAPVRLASTGGGPGAGPLPFDRPSARPTEPVTAGLPVGPGPGPEVLGAGGPVVDEVGARLRALYAFAPSNDLLRLIELHDQGY